MILEKNINLINSICKVELKRLSIGDSDFKEIYSSPSKINFRYRSSSSLNGLEYKHEINLNYPGLSERNIADFHSLLNDKFITKLTFNKERSYEIGSVDIPLVLTASFSVESGFFLKLKNTSFLYPELTIKTIESLAVFEEGVYENKVFE